MIPPNELHNQLEGIKRKDRIKNLTTSDSFK